MTQYKSCPWCGKIHPVGYKCSAKPVRKYRYSYEESKLRSKSAWTEKSIQIRNDAENMCEVCRDKGIYNYRDVSVHHIEKLKEKPELWLEDDNLICLCRECHRLADAGLIEKKYLHDLALKRMKRANL